MKKIISIMAVWDEQNMIALSIESTKDIIYEYIIIIKKGIDETRKVIEYCRDLWNLKVTIVESELKLREARKYAFKLAESYADYYLIQDGDEIYFTTKQLQEMGRKTILDLVNEDYDYCTTCMIYLRGDLEHTLEGSTWLVEHPFLVKNLPEIAWADKGDMPHVIWNWQLRKYKWYFPPKQEFEPFKFDCNIKNYRRLFLRRLFTTWHDTNSPLTIEEYNLLHNQKCIDYKKNVKETTDIEEIINYYKEHESIYAFCKIYDENKYYIYPETIKKYINLGLKKGIENLDDLKLI
jgi:hypothetical protein